MDEQVVDEVVQVVLAPVADGLLDALLDLGVPAAQPQLLHERDLAHQHVLVVRHGGRRRDARHHLVEPAVVAEVEPGPAVDRPGPAEQRVRPDPFRDADGGRPDGHGLGVAVEAGEQQGVPTQRPRVPGRVAVLGQERDCPPRRSAARGAWATTTASSPAATAWCTTRGRSTGSAASSCASTRALCRMRTLAGSAPSTARRASSCRNATASGAHLQHPALLRLGQHRDVPEQRPARAAARPRDGTTASCSSASRVAGRGGAPGRAPRRPPSRATSSAAAASTSETKNGLPAVSAKSGADVAAVPPASRATAGRREPREREPAHRRAAEPAQHALQRVRGRPRRRGTSARSRRRARRRGGRRSAARRGSRRRPSARPRRTSTVGRDPRQLGERRRPARRPGRRRPARRPAGRRGSGRRRGGAERARGQQVVARALQHASRGRPRPGGTRAPGSSCRCPPRRRRARRSPRPAPPDPARLPALRAHRRVRAAQQQPRRPPVRNGQVTPMSPVVGIPSVMSRPEPRRTPCAPIATPWSSAQARPVSPPAGGW